MTSVEKRKPFAQVYCEFLIPVQKTVPTKNSEDFKLVRVEMTWEQEIFAFFETFGQKSWSNQWLKQNVFFSILDKFYLPRLNSFG